MERQREGEFSGAGLSRVRRGDGVTHSIEGSLLGGAHGTTEWTGMATFITVPSITSSFSECSESISKKNCKIYTFK